MEGWPASNASTLASVQRVKEKQISKIGGGGVNEVGKRTGGRTGMTLSRTNLGTVQHVLSSMCNS